MIIDRKISTVRSAKNTRTSTQDQNVDIKNKLTESTVYMYGDIGSWFGIDHLDFIKDFNDISADVIHLRVDSQGGDVFAARAIKTAIQQHPANVVAHIDGLAASAASFIVMGADEVEIVNGGFLMIHNALSFMDVFGYFNAEDLSSLKDTIGKEITLHSKINDSLANDYIKKTGKDKEQILAWMEDETWFTAEEALENGFVDRIYDGDPVEGSYDLSVFAKTPELLQLRNQKASKRTIEKALRDVGLSNKEAKAVLAGTFGGNLRDEDTVADGEPDVIDAQRDVVTPDAEEDIKNDVSIKDSVDDVDTVVKPETKKTDRVSELLDRVRTITAPIKI